MSVEKARELLEELINNPELFDAEMQRRANDALAELSKPLEQGEFTGCFRAHCEVAYRDCKIKQDRIETVFKNTGWLGLEVRFAEGMLTAKKGLEACDIIDSQSNEIERHERAFERLRQWAKAYPLDAHPEPDFKAVRQALKEHGISLGAVSVSNMRHVITRVSEIIKEALEG